MEAGYKIVSGSVKTEVENGHCVEAGYKIVSVSVKTEVKEQLQSIPYISYLGT